MAPPGARAQALVVHGARHSRAAPRQRVLVHPLGRAKGVGDVPAAAGRGGDLPQALASRHVHARRLGRRHRRSSRPAVGAHRGARSRALADEPAAVRRGCALRRAAPRAQARGEQRKVRARQVVLGQRRRVLRLARAGHPALADASEVAGDAPMARREPLDARALRADTRRAPLAHRHIDAQARPPRRRRRLRRRRRARVVRGCRAGVDAAGVHPVGEAAPLRDEGAAASQVRGVAQVV